MSSHRTLEVDIGREILDFLMSRANGQINFAFMDRVDSELLGLRDYNQIITEPMWMGKMLDKFQKHRYDSLRDFVCDFRLMLLNCYRYNGVDSRLGRLAARMELLFEQKLQLLPAELRAKTSIFATLGGDSVESELADTTNQQQRKRSSNRLHGFINPRQSLGPVKSIMEELEHSTTTTLSGLSSQLMAGSASDQDSRLHLLTDRLTTWAKRRRDQSLLETWIDWFDGRNGPAQLSTLQHIPEFLELYQILWLSDPFLGISDLLNYQPNRPTVDSLSTISSSTSSSLRQITLTELELALCVSCKSSRLLGACLTILLASPKERSQLATALEDTDKGSSRGRSGALLLPYSVWHARLVQRVDEWYRSLTGKGRGDIEWAIRRLGISSTFFRVCGTKRSPLGRGKQFHQLPVYQRVLLLHALCESTLRSFDKLRQSLDRDGEWNNLRPIWLGCDLSPSRPLSYFHFPAMLDCSSSTTELGQLPTQGRIYYATVQPVFTPRDRDEDPGEGDLGRLHALLNKHKDASQPSDDKPSLHSSNKSSLFPSNSSNSLPVVGSVQRLPIWFPLSLGRVIQQRWSCIASANESPITTASDASEKVSSFPVSKLPSGVGRPRKRNTRLDADLEEVAKLETEDPRLRPFECASLTGLTRSRRFLSLHSGRAARNYVAAARQKKKPTTNQSVSNRLETVSSTGDDQDEEALSTAEPPLSIDSSTLVDQDNNDDDDAASNSVTGDDQNCSDSKEPDKLFSTPPRNCIDSPIPPVERDSKELTNHDDNETSVKPEGNNETSPLSIKPTSSESNDPINNNNYDNGNGSQDEEPSDDDEVLPLQPDPDAFGLAASTPDELTQLINRLTDQLTTLKNRQVEITATDPSQPSSVKRPRRSCTVKQPPEQHKPKSSSDSQSPVSEGDDDTSSQLQHQNDVNQFPPTPDHVVSCLDKLIGNLSDLQSAQSTATPTDSERNQLNDALRLVRLRLRKDDEEHNDQKVTATTVKVTGSNKTTTKQSQAVINQVTAVGESQRKQRLEQRIRRRSSSPTSISLDSDSSSSSTSDADDDRTPSPPAPVSNTVNHSVVTSTSSSSLDRMNHYLAITTTTNKPVSSLPQPISSSTTTTTTTTTTPRSFIPLPRNRLIVGSTSSPSSNPPKVKQPQRKIYRVFDTLFTDLAQPVRLASDGSLRFLPSVSVPASHREAAKRLIERYKDVDAASLKKKDDTDKNQTGSPSAICTTKDGETAASNKPPVITGKDLPNVADGSHVHYNNTASNDPFTPVNGDNNSNVLTTAGNTSSTSSGDAVDQAASIDDAEQHQIDQPFIRSV